MQKLFENFRRFINEEYDKALESKIRTALAEEGGTADMETLKEYTGATEEEIKSAMGDWEGVEEHPDGDMVPQGGDVKIISEGKEWKYN